MKNDTNITSLVTYKHSKLTKAISCLLIFTFAATNVTYGYDAPSNLRILRGIESRAGAITREFNSLRAIPADTPFSAKLLTSNNTQAITLSSGRVLVLPELMENDEALARAIEHAVSISDLIIPQSPIGTQPEIAPTVAADEEAIRERLARLEAMNGKDEDGLTTDDKEFIIEAAKYFDLHVVLIASGSYNWARAASSLYLLAQVELASLALPDIPTFAMSAVDDIGTAFFAHGLGHTIKEITYIESLLSRLNESPDLQEEIRRFGDVYQGHYHESGALRGILDGWKGLADLSPNAMLSLIDIIIRHIKEIRQTRQEMDAYLRDHAGRISDSVVEEFKSAAEQADGECIFILYELADLREDILHSREDAPVDINSSIREKTKIYENISWIQVNLDLGQALPPVRGSRVKISHIWADLIRNSKQAVNEEDLDECAIDIKTRRVRSGSADLVEIVYSDNGPGITQEMLQDGRLFLKGETNKRDGSGLGMYLVKQTVEELGGTIEVESHHISQHPDNHGTTFTIRLPVADETDATSIVKPSGQGKTRKPQDPKPGSMKGLRGYPRKSPFSGWEDGSPLGQDLNSVRHPLANEPAMKFADDLSGWASPGRRNRVPLITEVIKVITAIAGGKDDDVEDLIPESMSIEDYERIIVGLEDYATICNNGLQAARAYEIIAFIYKRYLSADLISARYDSLAFEEMKEHVKGAVSSFAARPRAAGIKKGAAVRVTAPARIDITSCSGSDLLPISLQMGGMAINAPIKLNGERPIKVTVKAIEEKHIIIRSVDLGAEEIITHKDGLLYNNRKDSLRLVKAALIETGIVREEDNRALREILEELGSGLEITTDIESIPVGSGLGISSILAAAVMRGLKAITGQAVNNREVLSHALNLEQRLGIGGGWQDAVGGIYSGIKRIDASAGYPIPTQREIEMPGGARERLEERTVLFYLGSGHYAGDLLSEIVRNYLLRTKEHFTARMRSHEISQEMAAALEEGNIDAFGKLLSDYWTEFKKTVGPSITSEFIESIFEDAEDLISGGRVSGAGGGGFMVLVAKEGKKEELKERLRELSGNRETEIYDCEFADVGMRAEDISTAPAEGRQAALESLSREVGVDTGFTADLVLDQIRDDLENGRRYEIRYDEERLFSTRVDGVTHKAALDAYMEMLRGAASHRYNIAKAPFSGSRTNNGVDVPIISVICRNRDGKKIGEGHIRIDVAKDKLLDDYALRVVGMLNLAVAAASVPKDLSVDEVDKYEKLLELIEKQHSAIPHNGQPLRLRGLNPDEIIDKITNIILKGLPRIRRVLIDEYNRMMIRALGSAV